MNIPKIVGLLIVTSVVGCNMPSNKLNGEDLYLANNTSPAIELNATPNKNKSLAEELVEKLELPRTDEIGKSNNVSLKNTEKTMHSDDDLTNQNSNFKKNTKNKAVIELAKKSGCFACHSVDKKVVGPAWNMVAERYKNVKDIRKQLITKVSKGGKGNWNKLTGGVPMPPYSPRVSDENIARLVDLVLSF